MLNQSDRTKYKSTYFFCENFYDPFENPYKIGDEIEIFTSNGSKQKVKVVGSTVIEQYRQYELEFSDKSTGWFSLNYLKSTTTCN